MNDKPQRYSWEEHCNICAEEKKLNDMGLCTPCTDKEVKAGRLITS